MVIIEYFSLKERRLFILYKATFEFSVLPRNIYCKVESIYHTLLLPKPRTPQSNGAMFI